MHEVERKARERTYLDGLFYRYYEVCKPHLVESPSPEDMFDKCHVNNISKLCEEAFTNGEKYPVDKRYRWLGFVQGVLAVKRLIDVDVERDFTRPLFHELAGKTIPTFDTTKD